MFLVKKLGTARTLVVCPIRLLERETSLLRIMESCFSTFVLGSFSAERLSHVARLLSYKRLLCESILPCSMRLRAFLLYVGMLQLRQFSYSFMAKMVPFSLTIAKEFCIARLAFITSLFRFPF